MDSGIYAIQYKERCAYVGCSNNIRRRHNQHRDTLKRNVHRNFLLQRAWNKQASAFSFITLEIVTGEVSLSAREQFYIDALQPWANLSDARGSHSHTDAAKVKMRKPKSAEHLKKIQEIAAARRGVPNGRKGLPTGRIPRSAFKKGLVPWNKGTKGVMVSWSKGKQFSEAHRLALSLAKLGKRQSSGTLAKRLETLALHRAERNTHAAD